MSKKKVIYAIRYDNGNREFNDDYTTDILEAYTDSEKATKKMYCYMLEDISNIAYDLSLDSDTVDIPLYQNFTDFIVKFDIDNIIDGELEADDFDKVSIGDIRIFFDSIDKLEYYDKTLVQLEANGREIKYSIVEIGFYE